MSHSWSTINSVTQTTLVIALAGLCVCLLLLAGALAGVSSLLARSREGSDNGIANNGPNRSEPLGPAHDSHLAVELARVTKSVEALRNQGAEQSAQLEINLRQAFTATKELLERTHKLSEVLGDPRSRGRWGEKMAEDLIQSLGMLEGVNYETQPTLPNGKRPDFAYKLPNDKLLCLDVKFPLDNYSRFLSAQSTPEANEFAKRFYRDVRNKIDDVGQRGYVIPGVTCPIALVFIPSESIYSFVFQNDPDVIDYAISKQTVLCSPMTLYSVLTIVRQAAEVHRATEKAEAVLSGLANLEVEWDKYTEVVEKVKRHTDIAQDSFEKLLGPRTKKMASHIRKLGALDIEVPDERGSCAGPAPTSVGQLQIQTGPGLKVVEN